MLLKNVYMGWKFQRTLKLDISFSLEHFFISVAIFTQVASAPLKKSQYRSICSVAVLKNQKQPLADVPQNRCSSKFFNIQRKRSVLEPLFNKVAGLHLSMNIANFVWKTSVAEVQ